MVTVAYSEDTTDIATCDEGHQIEAPIYKEDNFVGHCPECEHLQTFHKTGETVDR